MSEPSPSADVPVWARIKDHKIIQWTLGYLAAALALTHGEDLVAHAFDWPEVISRALIVVLAVGLPVAITLAWYHGHRAERHVSRTEATILVALLLVGAVVLWLAVRPHEALPIPPSRAATSPVHSTRLTATPRLAILPFENLSPDPANAFFADGLHEEILATLSSRARNVEVISRTTMMMYRIAPKSVEAIARELGATHVLEGSVRREGNTVRLTLQLINARTDGHVWSRDYDRTLKSALTLQSEVANEVAAQVSQQLTGGAETFKPPTQDPQAYDLYLQAALLIDQSERGVGTPADVLLRVEGLLNEALARDAQFADAYAARSGARMLRFIGNYEIDEHLLQLARQDLETAERLAPNDPIVLFNRGIYLYQIERNLPAALAALDTADAAGLVEATSISVKANALRDAGRWDEAIRRGQRALSLDPKNPLVFTELVSAQTSARRPAEALRTLAFATAEFPDDKEWRIRSAALRWGYTGDAQALREIATLVPPPAQITKNSDVETVGGQLDVLLLQNRYREAVDALERATTQVVRSHFTWGMHPIAELRGWCHLLLGDRQGATRDGREVLAFVAHSRETRFNQVALHLLRAEGWTFIGDHDQALSAARDTLSVAQWPADRVDAVKMVARVYAWSGHGDESAALLEQLSTALPVTWTPAEIARGPLFAVPLAGNARYQALKAKLEAQMAATSLE